MFDVIGRIISALVLMGFLALTLIVSLFFTILGFGYYLGMTVEGQQEFAGNCSKNASTVALAFIIAGISLGLFSTILVKGFDKIFPK